MKLVKLFGWSCKDKDTKSEPEPMVNFFRFEFLYTNLDLTCQVSEDQYIRISKTLANDDKPYLDFIGMSSRRCIVNLEYVTSIKHFMDKPFETIIPIKGVYLRILGREREMDIDIDIEGDIEPLFEAIVFQKRYIPIGHHLIKRQYFMAVVFDNNKIKTANS